MGRRVRANVDGLVLPDGEAYNATEEVVLTDEQFQRITNATLESEVTDLGYAADPGDAVVAQAIFVADPPAITSSDIGVAPTAADYNALRADVVANRQAVVDLLNALRGDGKPMAPS